MKINISRTKQHKLGSKSSRVDKLEIVCNDNSDLKFEIFSDDFSYHLTQCDNFLKKYLLYQARMEKEQNEILKYQKNNSKELININNSMINNINNKDIEESSSDNSDNEEEAENRLSILHNIGKRKNNKKRNRKEDEDDEEF